MRLRDQAVLVRAAHHSDLIELELTARRVPYRKYGGLRFVEAAHVKDFAAAVRLLDNPADELAWFRLLRMHDGIGPARGRMLLGLLAPSAGASGHEWREVVAAAPARTRVMLTRTLQGLEAARCQIGHLRTGDGGLPGPPPSRRSAVTATARRESRISIACPAPPPPWTTCRPGSPRSRSTRPVRPGTWPDRPIWTRTIVVISTVHSAKGLEWPAVHLPHLVDGAFPSDMALCPGPDWQRSGGCSTSRRPGPVTCSPCTRLFGCQSTGGRTTTGTALPRRAGSSRTKSFQPSTSKS